jgi:hypothetical protein
MKNNMILYLILLALIITNCKDNSVDPQPPSIKYDPLIPLNVGNYWLYKEYLLDPETGGEGNSPVPWKFGFIMQNLPQQPATILDSNILVMYLCAEDLGVLDDSKFVTYGGNKLVYDLTPKIATKS